MKTGFLKASLGLASVILLFAFGSASAADKWNLLAEKVIKSTDPSAEIQGQEGKTFKEDVKRTKLSVEGADVEITNVECANGIVRSAKLNRAECRYARPGRAAADPPGRCGPVYKP